MPSFFRKSLSFAFCSTCLRCSCALSISTFLPARRAILRWRTSFGRALPFPVCARPSRLRSCPSCYRSCHTTLTGLLDAVIVDGDESAFLLESERTRSVLVAVRRTCIHEIQGCWPHSEAKNGPTKDYSRLTTVLLRLVLGRVALFGRHLLLLLWYTQDTWLSATCRSQEWAKGGPWPTHHCSSWPFSRPPCAPWPRSSSPALV